MGFLSLFSKKGRSDKQGGRSPKSQPYESTVASLPPTRGAFPVAGNGPNVMETLSKSARFTQSQVSLSPAPSPTVPRFKDEGLGIERPRTAPGPGRTQKSEYGEGTSRKRTSMMKVPPVSYRPKTRDSLVPPPPSAGRLAPENSLKPLPITPPAPSSHAHAHSRTFSMRSDMSRPFVDLLDAQSEIKPTDFRTRVKATGARDYGEDVAERNMGQNGVDLQSSHAQAFYAGSAHAQSAEQLKMPLAANRAGPRRLTAAKSGPLDTTGVRTMSLNSSRNSFVFPQRTSSTVPSHFLPGIATTQNTQANTSRPVTGPTSRAMRRQTLNTYIHSPDTGLMGVPQVKARPMSFHRGASVADQGLHISATRANQHAPGWDSTSPEMDNMSPPLIHSAKQVPSPRRTKDPDRLPRGDSGEKPAIVPTDRFQFQFQFQQDEQPASVSRPRSSRGSVASSALASHHRGDSKRVNSLHTIQSSISSSTTFRETPTDFTPLAHPGRRGSKTAEDVGGSGAARPAYTTQSHSRDNSHGEVYHPRTKSLTSLPRPPFDELEDIPPRSSSIRNWSMTSATPTTSSTSSHTVPRSAHTANTSVDLGSAFASGRPSSRSSTTSGFRQSFCTAREMPPSPAKLASPGFNIDDYLSSDDDSFTAPNRPRGEGEEALLFADGYGMNATQLPGLLDDMSAPAPEVRSHRPRSSSGFLPAERMRRTFGYPMANGGGSGRRKYIIDPTLVDDHYLGDDLSDGASGLLLSTIPGLVTGGAHEGRRHTRRLSALGTNRGHGRYDSLGDQVIEEERLEKIDIATAVRMRKEAKQRKRETLSNRQRVESPYGAPTRGRTLVRETGDPDDADVEL